METTSTFLSTWDQYMYGGSIVCIIAGVLILLYHEFKVMQIKDYKQKYDYVNLHEVKYFWYAMVAFVLAVAIYANTVATSKMMNDGSRWFFVRLFITASFVVIAYFVGYSLVRIYYPRVLERRLSRLRNAPRLSPEGNLMRKLTESEEEHHLEDIKRAGGQLHTVDYDIWVDDATGYKKIEKYPAYQHAEECSECGFYTMTIDSEEIALAPTLFEQGLLVKHYKCSYCGHREQRQITVAQLSANIA